MPVVTDIKRQKKADSRYSIFIDGDFAFGLTDLDLSTSGLRVGQTLTATEVEQYRQEGEAAKVYSRALYYLSFRNRSRHEMADYLKRKGSEPEDIQAVIERLEQTGLINDQQFAENWIANRQLLRVRSRRKLEQELMVKGIATDDIRAALQQLDPDDELDAVVSVIERKRNQSQYRDESKLMGYLGRQGYSYDLIKRALERLNEK